MMSPCHIPTVASKLTDELSPGAASIDPLQVLVHTRSITASKCISKLARSHPPSASPNSLDPGLQLHLCVHSIPFSKYISKLAQSRPPSVSPNMLDYCLQVHLQSCSITASEYITEFTRSSFPGTPQIPLKWRLQPV